MSLVQTSVKFGSDFNGTLTTPNNSMISISSDQIKPYDMMLGALVACFHHTFLEVVGKKRQSVEEVIYEVNGRKRETVPTMLEYVKMEITVVNASDADQIDKSLELAKKYCSVFQTISHVAEIEVNVIHQTR